jgi:plastocyanin
VNANVHAQAPRARRAKRTATALLLAASALIALAGCGSSSKSSTTESTSSTPQAATTSTAAAPPASGGQTVSLEANKEGQLEYNTKTLSAKAGRVTIAFTNMSAIAHDVNVETASGEHVGGVEPFTGATKDVSVTLKPGTYKFYCSVPGHRQAGMEGTLTVR